MHINKLIAARVFLTLYYFVGAVGLSLEATRPLFRELTPFSLLVSAALLFSFHRPYSSRFIIIALLICLLGFGIEVIGVRTGRIFGYYLYGPGLGFSVLETPLVIGINWLTLAYCAWKIFQGRYPVLLSAVAGAFLMLMYDIVLEPVAVNLSWWIWIHGAIPLQNFIAWFVISFLFILMLQQSGHKEKNPVVTWLFLIQLLFLLVLNISL